MNIFTFWSEFGKIFKKILRLHPFFKQSVYGCALERTSSEFLIEISPNILMHFRNGKKHLSSHFETSLNYQDTEKKKI